MRPGVSRDFGWKRTTDVELWKLWHWGGMPSCWKFEEAGEVSFSRAAVLSLDVPLPCLIR